MLNNSVNDTIQIREYKNGDEEQIVPFLEIYMGWRSPRGIDPIEHWKWKYLDNPVGEIMLCVADYNGDLISSAASLPAMMKIGNIEVLAAQGVDLCTSPDFRGMGLIGKVSDCRDRINEKAGTAVDYGFPNRASSHISLEKRNFEKSWVRFSQFRYVINMKEFFRGNTGKAKSLAYSAVKSIKKVSVSPNVKIHEESEFNSEYDELLEECAKDFDIMIRRNSDYLNWRYADWRSGNFKIYSARCREKLCGYVVIGKHGCDASIADLLCCGDTEVLNSLIAQSINYAAEIKACSLLCVLPNGHRYSKRFSAAGFLIEERCTGDLKMSLVWKSLGLNEGSKNILRNKNSKYHITLGDTDWI